MGPNNRGRLARLPRICLIFLFVVVVKNLIGTQKIAFEGVMERAIATFTEETRVLRTELVSVGQASGEGRMTQVQTEPEIFGPGGDRVAREEEAYVAG